MNKVILVGRLTREPEVKYTPTGKMVATFNLAVDRGYQKDKEQREADFVPIVVWGKPAEFCGNYLRKGSKVLVDGRLQIRSYEKDGQKRYVTEIIANTIDSLSSKPAAHADPDVERAISSFGEDMNDEVPF